MTDEVAEGEVAEGNLVHRIRVRYFAEGVEDDLVEAGTGAWIAVERRWKVGRPPSVESASYAAWWALGRPGDESLSTTVERVTDSDGRLIETRVERFDAWLDGVREVADIVVDGETDEVPTPPAPAAG